jgi:hypothetical protein
MERDKFAARAGRAIRESDTAERGLFKQKQLILTDESVPRVVRVLTSFGLLLYDPNPQNGALGGS